MGEFMEKNSLIGLVERAADGDARAIEALYNATYSGAYSLAGHLCSNRNDVEDILQESYITAFSRLRYKGQGGVSGVAEKNRHQYVAFLRQG